MQAPGSDADLAMAWREYGFHSFDIAGQLFARVLETSRDAAERQQATIGRAMIAQFNTKQRDPEKAIRLYRRLLEEGLTGEPKILVESFLAECYAGTRRRDEANRLWDAIIADQPTSIVAQDALIARTLANMGSWDGEETTQAMSHLAQKRTYLPEPDPDRPGLAPPMERLTANWHFWCGRHRQARDTLIRFCDIATKRTTSYGWYAGTLFRTAQISERLLDDNQTAGRYYRRVITETPNHYQSFYALRRAAELGAIAKQEVRALKLNGITDDVIDGMFDQGKSPINANDTR